jgi:hypothetical protein
VNFQLGALGCRGYIAGSLDELLVWKFHCVCVREEEITGFHLNDEGIYPT